MLIKKQTKRTRPAPWPIFPETKPQIRAEHEPQPVSAQPDNPQIAKLRT